MQTIEYLGVAAAALLILLAAWQDLAAWKIRNWIVVALIGLYALSAFARWAAPEAALLDQSESEPRFLSDLAAGVLLFLTGFALWMFRLMGAGDAKFFFPIGLFVGWEYLLPFAFALIIGAVIVAVLLKFPIPIYYQVYRPLARIEEIRASGKVPYGVIMAAATLVVLYIRHFSS